LDEVHCALGRPEPVRSRQAGPLRPGFAAFDVDELGAVSLRSVTLRSHRLFALMLRLRAVGRSARRAARTAIVSAGQCTPARGSAHTVSRDLPRTVDEHDPCFLMLHWRPSSVTVHQSTASVVHELDVLDRRGLPRSRRDGQPRRTPA
jgi:hypothetical protein